MRTSVLTGCLFVLIVIACLGFPVQSVALESICPGGANARADITQCFDYDILTNCSTVPVGQSALCWSDNDAGPAPSASAYSRTIKSDGGAVGNGYLYAKGLTGGTMGSTVGHDNLINTQRATIRWYQRYEGGWAGYPGHGVQFDAEDPNSTCESSIKVQVSPWTVEMHRPASGCAGGHNGGGALLPNQGVVPDVQNGRWHLYELYAAMDTSCTTPSSDVGCDGVVKLWVDNVLISHYTNINFHGFLSGGDIAWRKVWFPQVYFHATVPPWEPNSSWDNAVISECAGSACDGTGPFIGCAKNNPADGTCSAENPRGTGDPDSPYRALVGADGYIGRRVSPDCSTSHVTVPAWSTASNRTLQSAITHGEFADSCSITVSGFANHPAPSIVNTFWKTVTDLQSTTVGATCTGGGALTGSCAWNGTNWIVTTATDMALRVNVPGNIGNGGTYWERGNLTAAAGTGLLTLPTQALAGWIYLPSSNNYTVNKLSLPGFYRSANSASAGHLALSITGGEGNERWAIRESDNLGTAVVTDTGVAAGLNQWVEYELLLWKGSTTNCASANGCITLSINRQKLLDKSPLAAGLAIHPGVWYWSNSEPTAGVMIGVLQFDGTGPFEAYFDDTIVTSASTWSCDGWGTDCPFSGLTGITTYSISGNEWRINGTVTYPNSAAEGLMMNVRMVNAIFEDTSVSQPLGGGYSASQNANEFIAAIPSYVAHGVRMFTIGLQGGNPNPVGSSTYNNVVNSAFNSDGTLKQTYLDRAESVIRAVDAVGALVNLQLFYFRQDQEIGFASGSFDANSGRIEAAVDNVCAWIIAEGFTNVTIELTNEYGDANYAHVILTTADGQIFLANRMRTCLTAGNRSDVKITSTVTIGQLNIVIGAEGAAKQTQYVTAMDFLSLHANQAAIGNYPSLLATATAASQGKPIIITEDPKGGEPGGNEADGVQAAQTAVDNGVGWGFFKRTNQAVNDLVDYFIFDGASEAQTVYDRIELLTTAQTPSLSTAPASFSFVGTAGAGNPPNQTLTITNIGTPGMAWTVTDNAAWLSVSPASGTDDASITISINTSGLIAGIHNANVTVTAVGASGSPSVVPVTLNLAPSSPSTISSGRVR